MPQSGARSAIVTAAGLLPRSPHSSARSSMNSAGLRADRPSQQGRAMSTLSDALDYAARGWHVFPLAPRSKVPLKGSSGFRDASTNPATLRRWFGQGYPYNIAIRTGLISGLLMLDADGQEGVENLERLQAEHGTLPATLMSQSSRGPHLWFKLTVPAPKNESKLAPKIDVRADGGYAVAPPSIHPSGAVYRWLNDMPPAPAPDWLIVLACVKPQPPAPLPRRGHRGIS